MGKRRRRILIFREDFLSNSSMIERYYRR